MVTALDSQKPALLRERRFRSLSAVRTYEFFIRGSLIACTVFSVLITLAIVVLLFSETVRFFNFNIAKEGAAPEYVSVADFAFGTKWNPLLGEEKHFGIWALISGTLWVTVIAMIVAIPLGLITAIYLSEYAPKRLRSVLKPALEVLAGIPTVVYGFFALTLITPFLRETLGIQVDFYNAVSAGIAVGILCLPTVSSLAEDALTAVPTGLREAGYGLGGTKFDVSLKVVFPAALSGIISAFLLAVARAIGETMIVALAAGGRARVTFNPGNEVQTMTAWMTQVAKGDVSNFSIEYYSIYAVAITLFAMTLTLTVLGHIVRKRFREAYE